MLTRVRTLCVITLCPERTRPRQELAFASTVVLGVAQRPLDGRDPRARDVEGVRRPHSWGSSG